jgi:hypothetical protein
MSLSEILLGMSEDEGQSLTDVQIVARLRDCFAHLAEVHTFNAGDIVLHKFPSMADTKGADAPGIFMGYLEQPVLGMNFIADPSDLHTNSAADTQDCRIAQIKHGRFVVHLHDSRLFRPHPDFPRG